jgi:hypothetical protein
MEETLIKNQVDSMNLVSDLLTLFRNHIGFKQEKAYWQSVHSISNKHLDRIHKKEQATRTSVPACLNWADKIISENNNLDILYMRYDVKEIRIRFLKEGKVMRDSTTGSLNVLTEKLKDWGIYRIHAKFSVNIHHVLGVDNWNVYMDDMRRLPWGETYKNRNWEYFAHLDITKGNGCFNTQNYFDCDL